MVNNDIDQNSSQVKLAKSWETTFINTVLDWRKEHRNISLSFKAERSVEDEINRQSQSDIPTVIVSYVVMFFYVAICLGNYHSWRTVLIDIKLSLSICGVLFVLASVFASIGFWSYVGVPATLVIAEVIPFLVLAVGVDNIFIIVQDFAMHADTSAADLYASSTSLDLPTTRGRHDVEDSVETRISRTLGRVGPSILLSSLAEAIAFFCGAMTTMPAVRVFSLYAGVPIVINFFLQTFAFTALLTLDARRSNANRLRPMCCSETHLPPKTLANDLENERRPKKTSRPWLYRFMAHFWTPFVLSKWMRPLFFIVFFGWICFCIAIIPSGMQVGLDQKLSMPEDSYVLEYFEDMSSMLAVGPPVYFVLTEGHRFDTLEGQNQICGRANCHNNSLVHSLKAAIRHEERSRLSNPLFSWVDDYNLWAGYSNCCMIDSGGKDFCTSAHGNISCQSCPVSEGRLSNDFFNSLIPNFLERVPDKLCPYGGKAQYSQALSMTENIVGASYFSAHHTVLRSPEDYIDSIRQARTISDLLSAQWNEKTVSSTTDRISGPPPNSVFPYSVFYVFYEQYLHIVQEATVQISMGLASVAIITWIMLGLDFVATLNTVLGVASIVLSVMAMMVIWEIPLNAISLVNLVVCIGISVEFCAHIVRAFAISTKTTRVERARDALSEMGSSVLRGITLTKFVGIAVLAFAKSRLFQIFYFRMYLLIVCFGALVGILFLPVQLSYIGPSLNRALLYKQNRYIGKRQRRTKLMSTDAIDSDLPGSL